MKNINIKSFYNELCTEDKEISKTTDFDIFCFRLQGEIQDLHDMVLVNGEQSVDNLAKLELIYTCISEVIRQGEYLLKNEETYL